MDHSKDQKLRDHVQQNRDSQEVTDGCQGAAHETGAISWLKEQIPQERRLACAGVLDAVTRT